MIKLTEKERIDYEIKIISENQARDKINYNLDLAKGFGLLAITLALATITLQAIEYLTREVIVSLILTISYLSVIAVTVWVVFRIKSNNQVFSYRQREIDKRYEKMGIDLGKLQ